MVGKGQTWSLPLCSLHFNERDIQYLDTQQVEIMMVMTSTMKKYSSVWREGQEVLS